MTTPLDDVDWLTRSENRVAVLEALIEERRERSALQELTGVSRVTSNRMLTALEERDWIRRDGHDYGITPTGRLVAEDLDRLLETTETAAKLSDIQQYIPADEFDFDLRRLADAEMVVPTPTATLAHLSRSINFVFSAEQVRVLAPNLDHHHVRTGRDEYRENLDQTAEFVIAADGWNAMMDDPQMSQWLRDLDELGDVSYNQYDGEITYAFNLIPGETAVLQFYDLQGATVAMCISHDDTVVTWAEETFEQHKRDAESVDLDTFTTS